MALTVELRAVRFIQILLLVFRYPEILGRAYGRAAAKAYAAYGTKKFLDYAVQSWWFGRAYTISSGDVSSGMIQSKTFPISKVCGYSECLVDEDKS
jgi:hypothetical protein